jgi:hypothetical protein
VEPTLDQYTHLGDGVTKTDGLVYNPALAPGKASGGGSGAPDDRWAFTSRSTALDYGAAAALAAASRVLRGYNDALADECLKTAVRVWDEEHAREPATFRFGNTTGGRIEDEELKATVELLITTKGQSKYADRLTAMWPRVEKQFAPAAAHVTRALPFMDPAFRSKVASAAAAYKAALDADLAKNPFGVPISMGGWGGSGGVLGFGMSTYVLHRAFPEIFGPEYTLRALAYVLGTHPASDVSLVSGVGAHSKTVAYGSNRADYTFIPGGVVPGVVLVKPDFLELKEDWPFLWFENEYVITAGASFVYLANAADSVLQEGHVAPVMSAYNGTPSRPVTILAGMRNAVSPSTRVVYERGVDLVEGRRGIRAPRPRSTPPPRARPPARLWTQPWLPRGLPTSQPRANTTSRSARRAETSASAAE